MAAFVQIPPSTEESTKPFIIKDEGVEGYRRMRVVCIGAGFSGILAAIRVPEWLRNVEFQVYEKNEGVGGTWWENRYPGCACDIPAHSYVYTFETNPKWTSFYARSAEIQQYLQSVADKYNTQRFIKLQHKVIKCVWDSDSSTWKIDIENLVTGEKFTDQADVVIGARGGLNDYKWPAIEGLKSFKGKIVHSAAWDEKFDYSHKRIVLLGSGSSAIQILPQLQKLPGTDLSIIIRNKNTTWIAEGYGESAMQKLGLDHDQFTKEDYEKYMSDPQNYHQFRKMIETELNAVHPFSLKGHPVSEGARKAFTALMKQRLEKKPELLESLLPKFAPGCRRLTPGPGFLEALTEDNVNVIFDNVAKITTTGMTLVSGKEIECDVIVCATGFNPMAAPPFPVVGLNGVSLQDRYEPYPEAYMSLATDGFPNFFSLIGPNSGVGSGSLTKIMEALIEYIIKCIRKLQKEDIRAMHISPRRVHDWNEYSQAYFQRTVFLDNCQTWYRKNDRVIGLWPGGTLHAIETLRSPRWEDFEYIYDDTTGNRLRWAGNGWTELQLNGGDISYYIEPEYVDYPAAPFPEQTERWQTVPFSH